MRSSCSIPINCDFILCFFTHRCFTIKTTGKTSNCSVCWFETSPIHHKFRVSRWVGQLLLWFIAMHSLTIHHLLAPLIIWQKVITWHNAALQRGTLPVISPPEQHPEERVEQLCRSDLNIANECTFMCMWVPACCWDCANYASEFIFTWEANIQLFLIYLLFCTWYSVEKEKSRK